ncbi:MAG: ArsC family (seleno)protein [Candidatus Eisenbacteria bacterium]
MSCKKTRAVLDSHSVALVEERSAGRAPLGDTDARALLGTVDTVIVAKGKSSRTLAASETSLDDLKGPTGGYRAPMVRKGRTLLVGFSEEALSRLLR